MLIVKWAYNACDEAMLAMKLIHVAKQAYERYALVGGEAMLGQASGKALSAKLASPWNY